MPQTLSAALPTTLLLATETFAREGELIMSMKGFRWMKQLEIKPEEGTVELVRNDKKQR